MKKTLFVLIAMGLIFMVGCEKVATGNYKEGTYFGSTQYDSYGTKYVTTATIYVNKDGKIASVTLDSTYNKDGVITTKKTLGDNYGMKETSAKMGKITGGAEWYEQVKVLEDKVVSEQGIDWLQMNNDKKTDSVSGVTITVDTYVEAINNALNKAKK